MSAIQDTKKDILQPNEQEVDMGVLWGKARPWFYGTLSVLVIVAAVGYIKIHQKLQQQEAEMAAQEMLIAATSEAALQTLIETHPKSDAATQAMVLLGHQRYIDNDFKSARDYYQKLY